MPRKRYSASENIDYYQRKIKELEEEQRRKRRRIWIESSSDSDDSAHSVIVPIPNAAIATARAAGAVALDEIVAAASVAPNEIVAADKESPAPTVEILSPIQEDGTSMELDPELLVALGEEPECTSKFGDKIHQSLAQRWEPLLKKGLSKEVKDKLFKEYLVPENCTLLQAPKLNHEVAVAISEAARQRDKRKETEQQQLGVGISAINKALTEMLTGDNKIEAIKILSDGCRILTDLHYQETNARISVINYALAKPFLNIVQDTERDDTLYGNKLAEKIKASKVIEKQGLSIKKVPKIIKNTSTTEQTAPGPSTRSQYHFRQTGAYQGNWSGPPRFQQNRGGRRGPSKAIPPTNRRIPPQQLQTSSAAGPTKRQSATRH